MGKEKVHAVAPQSPSCLISGMEMRMMTHLMLMDEMHIICSPRTGVSGTCQPHRRHGVVLTLVCCLLRSST